MPSAIYILTAFAMGAIYSIYLPMNSMVSGHIGSPIAANITFFAIALVTSILLFVIGGQFEPIFKLKVPPYLFISGFLSAFIILGMTFLIPILGPRKTFILTISGQVLMAMIVGHFGVFNLPKNPITAQKIIGAVLLIAGVAVTTNS